MYFQSCGSLVSNQSLSVEQLFQDSSNIHSHYVSDPSHLVKNDPLFDAKRASSFENSGIRRKRGPVNLHDTPKTILVEPLKRLM